jgi:hypothetical protein
MKIENIEIAYAPIALVLHMSSQVQAFGFLSCERTEADTLHLAGDFELDLRGFGVRLSLVYMFHAELFDLTYSLRHSDGGSCEMAHAQVL